MADLHPDQYLTKADAAQQFNRSERSLSRDVRRAIVQKNLAVLANAKLQLEDGRTLAGVDVELPAITRLVDEGQNPTWLFRVSWLQATYGKRGEPRPQSAPASPGDATDEGYSGAPEVDGEVRLPADKESRLAVLDALYIQQGREIRSLQRLIDKQEDREERNRKMQEQSNLLMKELSGLVRAFLDSSATPAGRPALASRPAHPGAEAVETIVINGDPAKTVAPSRAAGSSQVKPPRKPKGQQRSAKPGGTESTSAKDTSGKVKKEKAPAKEPSFAARHLPTLSKMFSRRSS